MYCVLFVHSVKAMLLLIDCKYKLIQKSSGPNNNTNGNGVKAKVANGTAEEKKDLIAMEANGDLATRVEEPSIPAAPGQDLSYGDVGEWINSLVPGRFKWNLRWVILKLNLMIDG